MNTSKRRRWLRIHDLATSQQQVGLLPVSAATLWRWVRAKKFPAPFKMGPNVTVWDAKEVELWIQQQAEQKPT